MQFDMSILTREFTENKLKVLSSAILAVQVLDEQGHVLEEFQTNSDEMIYPIQTPLIEGMTVEVKLVPGQIVAFYPVVNAL